MLRYVFFYLYKSTVQALRTRMKTVVVGTCYVFSKYSQYIILIYLDDSHRLGLKYVVEVIWNFMYLIKIMYSCSRFHNIHNLFNYIRYTHFTSCKSVERFVGQRNPSIFTKFGRGLPKNFGFRGPKEYSWKQFPFSPIHNARVNLYRNVSPLVML